MAALPSGRRCITLSTFGWKNVNPSNGRCLVVVRPLPVAAPEVLMSSSHLRQVRHG